MEKSKPSFRQPVSKTTGDYDSYWWWWLIGKFPGLNSYKDLAHSCLMVHLQRFQWFLESLLPSQLITKVNKSWYLLTRRYNIANHEILGPKWIFHSSGLFACYGCPSSWRLKSSRTMRANAIHQCVLQCYIYGFMDIQRTHTNEAGSN